MCIICTEDWLISIIDDQMKFTMLAKPERRKQAVLITDFGQQFCFTDSSNLDYSDNE